MQTKGSKKWVSYSNILLMSTLAPEKKALSPAERLAATLCLAVATLMCGTACFNNINTGVNPQFTPSKPVEAPAAPRASQSAATLRPGAFRAGLSADGAGFTPKSGEGTSVGQGAVNARLGFSPRGLELDAGIAFPVVQPFGLARFQVAGQGSEKGPFSSLEVGGGAGGAFAGASLGMPMDQVWEVQLDGRGGSYFGDGYGEIGLGVVLHAGTYLDMIAGTGYRYYGSGLRPNVTRGGVSLEFGSALKATPVEIATERYQGDPELLLQAGEIQAAKLACQARLKDRSQRRRSETWELYGKILQAEGNLSGARKAFRKAYQLKPAPEASPIVKDEATPLGSPSKRGKGRAIPEDGQHDPEQ